MWLERRAGSPRAGTLGAGFRAVRQFAHPRPTCRPGCGDTSDGFFIVDRYHRTDTDGPSPVRAAADLKQAL
jgi:hypothetical protein